ncbi:hypothetical protein FOQG_17535 [Fusarium oxysporum f. sp. raphani 54005]|uniref:Uncharacterized protein n=2 Tax=Fusarium oxysporum f. sp. raphani TaxID=96318 RepID=X0B7N7_FUSOX|nr:hypothetical protein FOQG_17535 [Fusarium oxysporum f. sp. raphani 54005]KAG7435021.1 hypothetical protein Forpi1262_v005409 [Fusarium oxysporum f. sp. raphani]
MSLVITKIAAVPPDGKEQLKSSSIYCTLKLERSDKKIPEQLLERPPLDEETFRGRVPAHLLEPGRFWRLLVDRLPSVRIIEARPFEYCNVSVADSCLDFLLDLDFPIEFGDWAIFHYHLEEASPEIQHQFFQLCASLAPSLDNRTDESWYEHFQKICTADKRWKAKHARSLGILHLLFQSAGGKGMRIVTKSPYDYASTSVNDNLADLRWLFGNNCTDQKAFNELNIEDRITRYVPIGFPRAVYETLPAALINILPLNTVKGAQCMIAKTYQMMNWIKKAENDFLLLLCYCATLQKADDHLRKWVDSSEGQHEYYRVVRSLKQPVTPEELAMSLTALCFFERLLREVDEDTGHEHESWIASLQSRMSNLCVTEEPGFKYSCVAEFIEHMTGNKSKTRPNLWQMVGASFRKACVPKKSGGEWRCNLTALGWLATVIHDEQRTDDLVEVYWDNILTTSVTVANGRPRTASMRRQG